MTEQNEKKLQITSAVAAFLRMIWLVFLAASVAFSAAAIFGYLRGDALATAAWGTLVARANIVSAIEPQLPRLIVAIAMCGALSSWLAHLEILDRKRLMRAEERLQQHVSRWGAFVILALFVFSLSSSGWAGRFRATDTVSSIFGQMPYNDASAYYSSALFQSLGRQMSEFGARRPAGQAARDLMVLAADGSYTTNALLQTLLLGMALSFAAWRLRVWRGLWPSVAFVGLIYLHARVYLSTTLTEPLGMIAILFAIGVLIDAVRLGSARHALIALAGVSLALSIRMGALLVLPLLIYWAATLEGGWKPKWSVVVAGVSVVAAVFAMSFLLGRLYGPPSAQVGSNFSLTLCGLSIGQSWTGCLDGRYAREMAQLPQTEAAAASFFFKQAVVNFIHQPWVFFLSLFKNMFRFLGGFIRINTGGHHGPPALPVVAQILVLILALPGLIYSQRKLASHQEKSLWLLLFLGILASAAIIMADDGWRALHVSHAITACFLAFCCITPHADTISARPISIRFGMATVLATLAALLVAPALLKFTGNRDLLRLTEQAAQEGTHVVAGGKWVAGFVVVPDGAPVLRKFATVGWNEFRGLFEKRFPKQVGEPDVLEMVRQRMPVAFVAAAPLTPQLSGIRYYLAPAAVVEQRGILAWRLQIDAPQTLAGRDITILNAREAAPVR